VEALAQPGESLDPVGAPGIFRIRAAQPRPPLSTAALEDLERLAKRNDGGGVRGLMLALAGRG
jgi:hypothetical protein